VNTWIAFAASKTAMWADRRAPRDLWDLWALARIGAIAAAARELYRTIRSDQSGSWLLHIRNYTFETPPSGAEWQSQLAGQTRVSPSTPSTPWRSFGKRGFATLSDLSTTQHLYMFFASVFTLSLPTCRIYRDGHKR
jgi:Nucleotidyl transferase AbiEii toxin, Type IV TA system